MIHIDLAKLNFTFQDKPLLIGGKAMEYYNIRKAGADIDFVISARDHVQLVKKYPDHLKNLFGDIGVIEFEFEIWNTICNLGYDTLREDAVEEQSYLVVSIQKLLVLKAMAMYAEDKYRRDAELIGDYIRGKAYSG